MGLPREPSQAPDAGEGELRADDAGAVKGTPRLYRQDSLGTASTASGGPSTPGVDRSPLALELSWPAPPAGASSSRPSRSPRSPCGTETGLPLVLLTPRNPGDRRCSIHSLDLLGSHVGWQALLEFAGDTEEAWRARRVHRWLAVSEADAAALLFELRELRSELREPPEKPPSPDLEAAPRAPAQPERSASLVGWFFGLAGCVGQGRGARPMEVVHENTVQYSFERLEEIGQLGYGGFGSVTLVKCGATGQNLALKAVSKGRLVKMEMEEVPKAERDTMRAVSSPFVLRLAATFNRGEWLYFLMEPAMGGELYTIYAREGLWGSAPHARFYAACILSALEHLHGRRIIYRDLKMENMVLDWRGYCKLCDFGAATFKFDWAYTMCGTPEYMAPEVIAGRGHNRAVDWWALGVLVHELMTGNTPFVADEHLGIFTNVREGIEKVSLPPTPWADLVRGLCEEEPSRRLAMRCGGTQNVKEHAWFLGAGFDWPLLERRGLQAPYEPDLEGPADLRNFTPDEQVPPVIAEYEDPGSGWDCDFEDSRGPLILP